MVRLGSGISRLLFRQSAGILRQLGSFAPEAVMALRRLAVGGGWSPSRLHSLFGLAVVPTFGEFERPDDATQLLWVNVAIPQLF